MSKFRKGDVVTIEGTIDSGFEHEGKIKIRVEPYSDVYANVADIKMVRPVINVGDSVTYPADGYKAGTVLAIIDGWCWAMLSTGYGSERVSWPISCINRVDPEPEPVEAPPRIEDAA